MSSGFAGKTFVPSATLNRIASEPAPIRTPIDADSTPPRGLLWDPSVDHPLVWFIVRTG